MNVLRSGDGGAQGKKNQLWQMMNAGEGNMSVLSTLLYAEQITSEQKLKEEKTLKSKYLKSKYQLLSIPTQQQ